MEHMFQDLSWLLKQLEWVIHQELRDNPSEITQTCSSLDYMHNVSALCAVSSDLMMLFSHLSRRDLYFIVSLVL